MKILVVDDEKLGRKRIVNLLKECNYSEHIYQASSGKEAIKSIKNLNPEILFLDIQMTDMSGFDVLMQINPKILPVVIFATAFDTFALKAFEFQALDFLLKPFNKNRFLTAFHRAIEMIEKNKKSTYQQKIASLLKFVEDTDKNELKSNEKFLDKITLKTNNKYFFIAISDIIYIKSAAYYAEIFQENAPKKVHRITSMNALEEKLDPSIFRRINRSTIIRLDYIKSLVSEGLGDYSIIMQNNEVFQLTKKYKADLLKQLNIKS